MSTSKVRIKMGPIEVDYEGTEEFLKAELPSLLDSVSKLYKESGVASAVTNANPPPGAPPATGALAQGTTATFAAKLGSNSGPDLILAAAARLTFSSGKQNFSRKELHDEIKTADGYYKKTYTNNFSKYLRSLVSDNKLLEISTDSYSLNSSEKNRLEARLAQP